ncbi:MAG: DUF3500 domain-containing protein [Planctomycetota bacterium]
MLHALSDRSVRQIIGLAGLLATGAILLGMRVGEQPAEQMQTFATAFLDTLDESQSGIALQPYDSEDRVGWHFIPKDHRKGLMMEHMNDAQQTAALRLLRSALSEAGYTKANRIMLLEEVLNEMEAGKGRWDRNPLRYYVTIFGDPRANPTRPAQWGLSFEGHHLSLNFVCRDGEVVDSTPQFLASNPATVMNPTQTTLGKGTRVLRLEEQLAFDLINAIPASQMETAVISEDAPAELRFAGDAQSTITPAEGITFASLGLKQQAILKELVGVYFDVAPDAVAAERYAQVDADGWDSVHFAWAGATKAGIGHYYRIQGKRFLIEFVNTQADPMGNPANHIHCVLRDLTGDFDLPIR